MPQFSGEWENIMADFEHIIDTNTNTNHVFIAWDNGECVRYSVDSDGNIWLTGYGMEDTHAIQNEYEIGEHLIVSLHKN